jgi:hypothetical protein
MDLQRIVLNIADTGNSIQICVIKAETKWSREQIVCLFNSSTSAHLTLFPFMEQFQYFLKDPVKYDVKYQVCLSWLSFGYLLSSGHVLFQSCKKGSFSGNTNLITTILLW